MSGYLYQSRPLSDAYLISVQSQFLLQILFCVVDLVSLDLDDKVGELLGTGEQNLMRSFRRNADYITR